MREAMTPTGEWMRSAAALTLVLLLAGCRNEQPAQQTTASAGTSTAASSTDPVVAGAPKDMTEQRVDRKLTHEPIYLDSALLGKGTQGDGSVATEASKFTQGEPVVLTMKLKESPSGLTTRVEWKDVNGRTIHEEQRPMNGAKAVTFSLKKRLEPGGYQAVGYWGGNVACEIPFTVAAK
jgi:hypothetical protein